MFVTFYFLCVCLSSPHRPSISVLLLLGGSAQQRSSQTNKSQSSAGNQVSICHVSCVKQWRSREYCTPTQWQDGYCKENTKSWNERDLVQSTLFHLSKSYALHKHYVICILPLHCFFRLCYYLFLPFVMHVVLCFNWAPTLNSVFYFDLFISLFLFASSSLSERISWVLLLFATIITGVVVVETFPFVWTPPVSSRCHFAFHPHPLVRISAALLAGCLLVSIAHCGLWFAM